MGRGIEVNRHWALDRRAYRRKRERGIPSLECVSANGSTFIHTGTGSRGPGWAKGVNEIAYVMPNWAAE